METSPSPSPGNGDLGAKVFSYAVKLLPPSLLATFLTRLFADNVPVAVFQLGLTSLVLVVLPIASFLGIRRYASGWLALIGALGITVLLLLFASLLSWRPMRLNSDWHSEPALASALLSAASRPIKSTGTNRIHLRGKPVVVRSTGGDIHVLVDVTWQRVDFHGKWDRTYQCRVHLVARSRSGSPGHRDPFEVTEFSCFPYRGIAAYMLAWLDAPFLFAESDKIGNWVEAHLEGG